MRHTTALGLVAIAACLVTPCAQAGAAESVAPLPSSNYSIRPACGAATAGQAACLALQLVPQTSEARAHTHPLGRTRSRTLSGSPKDGSYGLTPQELQSAYALLPRVGSTQTIALVDAYNDPNAASDLKAYEEEFDLKKCTEAGCFERVNQQGGAVEASLPFPKTTRELDAAKAGTAKEREEASLAEGWDVEISLDIEAARAVCPSCHILLVEANSPQTPNLDAAEAWAAEGGKANEISNSWAGAEEGESTTPFDHPRTVITAAAGDDGYLNWDAKNEDERGYPNFPASSPDVVAVGGTRLLLGEASEWQSETVWNDGGESRGSPQGYGAGGSGCSEVFTAPAWQQSVADWSEVGCGEKRAVADVAADADPYTGFAVYDTNPAPEESTSHWYTYGGTSLASPIIAAVFALAGGAGEVAYPAKTLYENEKRLPTSLHDVEVSSTSGSNGKCSEPFDEETFLTGCTFEEEAQASCSSHLICLAHEGYDGPTGVGAPNGISAFETEEEARERVKAEAEAKAAAERKVEAEAKATEELKVEEEAKTKDEAELREEAKLKEAAKAQEEAKAAETRPLATSPSIAPLPSAVTPIVQTTPPPTVRISTLTLTLKALLALDNSRPKLSQVGFAFTINAPARVSVTLEKRTRTHGHLRWVLVRHAAAITAVAGRNTRNLSGSARLRSGLYRLTLTPAHVAAQSITFQIG